MAGGSWPLEGGRWHMALGRWQSVGSAGIDLVVWREKIVTGGRRRRGEGC